MTGIRAGQGSVTRRELLLVLLLVAVVAALAGAGLSWWLLRGFTAHVPLAGQDVLVSLPETLPVQVEIMGAVGDGTEGSLPVRLNERLHLRVRIDAEVPLRTTVRYRGEIPVQTTLPLDTTIETRLLGLPVKLPVKGEVPLSLRLPVDLQIPVDQPVRLRMNAPITADIDQVVRIPLRGVLDSRIQLAPGGTRIRVEQADMSIPLRRLSLEGAGPLGGDWRLGPLEPPAAAATEAQ